MYIRGIFETLAYEWDNLEVWRQDKFMMVGAIFFVIPFAFCAADGLIQVVSLCFSLYEISSSGASSQ